MASQTSLLISERIVYVNEHFTRTLHHSICRALFNVDRQLFTVLLAFAALRSKVHLLIIFIMMQSTYLIFFRVMFNKKQLIAFTQKNRCPRVIGSAHLGSITSHGSILWIWVKRSKSIIALPDYTLFTKTIKKFFVSGSLKDLPNHMECNVQEWQDFCLPSNVADSLPSPWNKLEPLEQLLVIKHLKPDCFAASIVVISFIIYKKLRRCIKMNSSSFYRNSSRPFWGPTIRKTWVAA